MSISSPWGCPWLGELWSQEQPLGWLLVEITPEGVKGGAVVWAAPSWTWDGRVSPASLQGIVQQFLVLLTTSPDESLRFLSFRLDFNEHYRAREPRLHVSLGARDRRSSHTWGPGPASGRQVPLEASSWKRSHRILGDRLLPSILATSTARRRAAAESCFPTLELNIFVISLR